MEQTELNKNTELLTLYNNKNQHQEFVACQNATIRLAGVGGPRDPTIARGNIRSLLKYLELAT
jgi:hypothetical protein